MKIEINILSIMHDANCTHDREKKKIMKKMKRKGSWEA